MGIKLVSGLVLPFVPRHTTSLKFGSIDHSITVLDFFRQKRQNSIDNWLLGSNDSEL